MAMVEHRGKVGFVVTFDLDAYTYVEGEPNDSLENVIQRFKGRMEPDMRTRIMAGISRVMSDQMAHDGIVGIAVSEGAWSDD